MSDENTINIKLEEKSSDFPKSIIDENGEEIKIEYEKSVKPKREEWSNRFEFILCCIGTAVGLGNVWRFPYLCYKNGGGAFLIPYTITLCFIGLPLFFMELALGQFASQGAIGIWSISPMFKGIGYGMTMVSGLVCIYYNIIIAQCLFYFGVSFTSLLPWSNCNNSWNNRTLCYDGTDNSTQLSGKISPSEEYYEKHFLNMSDGIEDMGWPQWRLLVSLVIAWCIVIVILLKGIKYMGKVSYFTALFPYIILTILLIRGLVLPGSLNGILYYIRPDFKYLRNPRVWVEAATQIFFSLSVCNGNLITMSSYNKFTNNCLRDAVLVAVINCATSVYGGLVIFSNMGFMAFAKNVSMTDVVKGGPGLAFKVYPEALTKMPLSPLWSVLFFLMMIILGIGSQIALVETVLAGLQDELVRAKKLVTSNQKILYRLVMCLILFVLGVPMTCRGGMYVLEIFDGAVSGSPMLILALVEVLVVSYCYGIERFRMDIKLMIGYKPNKFWKYSWMIISPFLIFILIIGLTVLSILKKSTFPIGFVILQIVLSLLPIFFVISIFAFVYCKKGGWLLFSELKKPLHHWGPAHDEHKQNFYSSIQDESKTNSNFFQSKESILKKFHRRLSQSENDKNRINSSQEMEMEKLINDFAVTHSVNELPKF
uniref:Transporter n=1 Tax=Schmidtea mediterranea TaxID=79327 RepID=A0A0H3YIZ1_SCHMD|nr:slc6a-9 [Schmidtea mediterranea]